MNLKFNLFFVAILTMNCLLVHQIRAEIDKGRPVFTPTPFCDDDILYSFGIDGYKKPVKMELDMCPTIELSCCKVKDQLTIYSHWIHGKEAKNLQKRFKYHYNVYAHLTDSLIKVFPIAKMIQDKLKNKKVSNCKVLARKILHFEIKDIAPKLKEAVRTMHEFFFDSYKGMYCMLCDAYTHEYFIMDEKKIIFSERFCRDIVANSLHVLLYFHIHFVKFLNLVGTFLATCDNRGRFNEKAALLPQYIFHVSGKAREEVDKCKQFRNDPTWFKMCKPLCQNFQLTKFNKFFQPHLKKYRLYAEFLEARIKDIKNQEKNDPLNQPMDGPGRLLQQNNKLGLDKGRILHAAGGGDKGKGDKGKGKGDGKGKGNKGKKKKRPSMIEKLRFEERKWKNLNCFRSTLNAVIPIDLFKSCFEDPGIDLYEFGKASLIDDARYKQVKTLCKKKGPREKGSSTVLKSGLFSGNGISNFKIMNIIMFALLLKFGTSD